MNERAWEITRHFLEMEIEINSNPDISDEKKKELKFNYEKQ